MNKTITRTLVSRNINCSELNVDDFVKAMFCDVLEAEEIYNENYCSEYVKSQINFYESKIKFTKDNAYKYASKKWKTQKKQIEYVMEQVNKAKNDFKLGYYDHISFFDFNVNPGSMGISDNCIITISNLTFEKLEKCFNVIKDNEYFKNALGWELIYDTYEGSYRSLSRPQIKLILNDDMQNKMNKEREDLEKSVMNFYRNTTYFGD